MTKASETLLAKICQWPVDARIEVACLIWESLINENAPIEFTEAQKKELDRRLAEREANPTTRRTWEEFEAEQLRRHS